MKKIYYILLAMLAMGLTFTACSEKDPFSTATADDEPRILDPIFQDGKDGNLPVIAEISRDGNLTIKLTVTPADHTDASWFIDGQEVQKGKTLDISLKAGTYRFKVIVSTDAGKSTYREGTVKVNPMSDDPWGTQKGFERIVVPGNKARLYGDNLDKVKSIVINGKTITDIVYIESEDGNYIEYTVPADLDEGEHRVILVDAASMDYGANTVIATRTALVTGGAARTSANQKWIITGVNLDQIASLTFAGQTITEFTQQTATEIAIVCPELKDGKYTLMGKTKRGEEVQFYNASGIVTEQTVNVSSEIVLWEGHQYVSWERKPDAKVFKLEADVFNTTEAGAIISVHYSLETGDDYHQMQINTIWWTDLPDIPKKDFTGDGVEKLTLTQGILNLIKEQGFQCVGHGYYVDMVTVE